jgi:hypothetical protein
MFVLTTTCPTAVIVDRVESQDSSKNLEFDSHPHFTGSLAYACFMSLGDIVSRFLLSIYVCENPSFSSELLNSWGVEPPLYREIQAGQFFHYILEISSNTRLLQAGHGVIIRDWPVPF